MKLLLQSVTIIDKQSSHHLSTKDILIERGKIKQIAKNIKDDSAKKINLKGASLSQGWIDMNCHIYEPGLEYREDIASGTKAAAKGGFTSICYMPNTMPAIDTKAQVEFVLNRTKKELVNVMPVGALSQSVKGVDLAEIYDMQSAGAVAYADGNKAIQNGGLLERALLYVKKFDGLVMNHPEDRNVSRDGVMTEGVMSTQLGLHAAPKLAEDLMVQRDIYLAEHTDSRLHFINVSTAKSVQLIKEAKKKGLKVTAAVNAYNLLLTDEALAEFDTNYKVNPHLRSKEDVKALIKGLKDGTIDAICSGHKPLHEDEKKVEFDHADFGISALESCFAVARKATDGKLDIEDLVEKMANNPAKILGKNNRIVEEGNRASFTIFKADKEIVFEKNHIFSKSKNTPFVGMSLKGEILGIVNGTKTDLI